jgi:hypothetical protein
MALIVYSSFPAEARGKLGGVVFSRNAAGAYARTKVNPVQPRSPSQIEVRAAVTYLAQYWRDTMTPTLRAAWEMFASTTPLPNRLGVRKPRSGITAFLRANTFRQRHGIALLTAAPPIGGEAAMQTATFTATDATGIFIATISPSLAAGEYVDVLRCTAPTSQARNYFSGPFVYATYLITALVYPLGVGTPSETQVGQRWWFKMRRYDALGKVGPTSLAYIDVLT